MPRREYCTIRQGEAKELILRIEDEFLISHPDKPIPRSSHRPSYEPLQMDLISKVIAILSGESTVATAYFFKENIDAYAGEDAGNDSPKFEDIVESFIGTSQLSKLFIASEVLKLEKSFIDCLYLYISNGSLTRESYLERQFREFNIYKDGLDSETFPIRGHQNIAVLLDSEDPTTPYVYELLDRHEKDSQSLCLGFFYCDNAKLQDSLYAFLDSTPGREIDGIYTLLSSKINNHWLANTLEEWGNKNIDHPIVIIDLEPTASRVKKIDNYAVLSSTEIESGMWILLAQSNKRFKLLSKGLNNYRSALIGLSVAIVALLMFGIFYYRSFQGITEVLKARDTVIPYNRLHIKPQIDRLAKDLEFRKHDGGFMELEMPNSQDQIGASFWRVGPDSSKLYKYFDSDTIGDEYNGEEGIGYSRDSTTYSMIGNAFNNPRKLLLWFRDTLREDTVIVGVVGKTKQQLSVARYDGIKDTIKAVVGDLEWFYLPDMDYKDRNFKEGIICYSNGYTGFCLDFYESPFPDRLLSTESLREIKLFCNELHKERYGDGFELFYPKY